MNLRLCHSKWRCQTPYGDSNDSRNAKPRDYPTKAARTLYQTYHLLAALLADVSTLFAVSVSSTRNFSLSLFLPRSYSFHICSGNWVVQMSDNFLRNSIFRSTRLRISLCVRRMVRVKSDLDPMQATKAWGGKIYSSTHS